MARRKFFKTWKKKAKQILHHYLLRMIKIKKKCFGERFYIYCVKTDIRPPSSDLIIILDNKDINKPSPPSFHTNIVMKNKNIKNTKNKGDLKNLQPSYSKSLFSSINKNILDGPLFKSSIFPKIERPVKRRKKAVPKYK